MFRKRSLPVSRTDASSGSWLVPAVISAVVALLTTAISTTLQYVKDSAEDRREVVRVRAEILKAAGESKSLLVASLLHEHVLKPIDRSEDREKFGKRVNDYIASIATSTVTGTVERAELSSVANVASGDIQSLLALFEGTDRLAASNALLERSRIDKATVVAALVAALRPPTAKLAYRVNLYIVFTLARMPGGWQGTRNQVESVRALVNTAFADDETFRARLDEALANT